MDREVLENHQRYLERVEFYRGFGYDLEAEREYILDSSLPVSGRILEIGTGKGHFALALARRGFSFVSIDISAQEQAIALLNMRYSGLEQRAVFKIENAERMSFADREFDAVFSINVFHHLERPVAVLDEIVRVLRPGGKAVLADFSPQGLEIINACHTHEGRVHDYFKHRLDEAGEYFVGRGWEVREAASRTQRVLIADTPCGARQPG